MEDPLLIQTSRGLIPLEELVTLISSSMTDALVQALLPYLENKAEQFAIEAVAEDKKTLTSVHAHSRNLLLRDLFPGYPIKGGRFERAGWYNRNGMRGYGSALAQRGIDPIHLLIFQKSDFASIERLRTDRAWEYVEAFRVQFGQQLAELRILNMSQEFLYQRCK